MSLRPIKRAVRVTGGSVLGLLACAAVANGLADASAFGYSMPSELDSLVFAAVLVLVGVTAIRRLSFRVPSARAQRVSSMLAMAPLFADLEVSLALVAAVYALLAATGGIESSFYPMLYGVVAFSATLQVRSAVVVTVAAVFTLEVCAGLRTGGMPLEPVVTHLVFVAGATVAHAVFLRALVTRLRADHFRRVEASIRRQRDSARDYRLISSSLGAESRAARSRADEEAMLAAGGVAAIHSSLYFTLSMLSRALRADSTVLLWVDERGERFKIKEAVTESDDLIEAREVPLVGVAAAVVRDRVPLTLSTTKTGQVCYYDRTRDVGSFVGVPVMEGQHLRGVLCADRQSEPFDPVDVAAVSHAAEQVMEVVRSEQLFSAVERAKYEHERFYQASALLCEALTLEQVVDTAFDAAAAIVDYDAAVVTLYDATRRRHRVTSARVTTDGMIKVAELSGLEFRDNAGLVSMVVKNRHYLPAAGELRDVSTPVFTKNVRFRGAESLLVLPLCSADECIGTFTLVSRHRSHFRKDTREMLGVIANQVAISLQNALMYKKMETMATTDGLTGLTNHRTFQDRFRDLLERAGRHGHEAAVLLCDVDHFKSVNDNYGHPVGDEVLRQVARVLQEAVRKIDIPARYGGEEFAVVLEATDLKGAMGLAERIRQDVGRLSVDSEKGPFGITMSIGVATFPADSRDQAELIEKADMALYHAKESGRNRVVSFQQFDEARRSKRAS